MSGGSGLPLAMLGACEEGGRCPFRSRLPAGIAARPPQPADDKVVRLPLDLATVERRAIEAALRATNGNRARAAPLLRVTRQT
jgi:transcriptional regulator with PAS, ATPase and Fis domain